MHLLRRQRSKEVIENVEYLLEAMAFDNRLLGGLSLGMRPFESTASAPSLRASEHTPQKETMAGDVGGNVKVVVRVRQFIPRGNYHYLVHVLR